MSSLGFEGLPQLMGYSSDSASKYFIEESDWAYLYQILLAYLNNLPELESLLEGLLENEYQVLSKDHHVKSWQVFSSISNHLLTQNFDLRAKLLLHMKVLQILRWVIQNHRYRALVLILKSWFVWLLKFWIHFIRLKVLSLINLKISIPRKLEIK